MTYHKPELVLIDRASRVVLGAVPDETAFDSINSRPEETEQLEW